jgi:flagellar biosynthesis/type III secretory pathway M-ring protein FliF/YscJ
MDRLRTVLATISAALTRLNPSQKMLIASIVVLMAMTLLLVQLYSGKREMVPLMPGMSADDQASAVQFLSARAVKYSDEDGQIMVPADARQGLIAQMSEAGAMPGDSRILFDNLIDKQSWTLNQRQNQQLETIAVQNELAAIIGKMSGIRRASVILNLPDKRSLGNPSTTASAAATVFPTRSLDQNTVDSIAHLVAGSRGIDPKHVRVIDGSTNRQFRAREEGTLAASTYLEYVAAIEARKQQQILEMLAAYIQGVIVTVHAQVDVTQRRTETNSVLPEGKGSVSLLKSDQTMSREDRQPSSGGEPGPRSNTQEDVTVGASVAGSSKESTGDSQFQTEFGRETKTIVDPRGNPTKINAVVNIPRPYFVEIWRSRQGKPADAAAPDAPPPEPAEADLQPIIDSETARIKHEVELQIDTSASEETVKGEVQVSMIPVAPGSGSGAAVEPASILGIPTGSIALDGAVKNIALGGLAVVALGLVVLTALKSSKREPLPTAAELVGLPPTLDGGSDLVGEAGEAESALTGIELTDEQMRTRKISEQVAAMVSEKPEDAARLIGRWIAGP